MAGLEDLTTEEIHPAHARLDELPTLELLQVMNREDRRVAEAVAEVIPDVARAVDVVVHAFQHGGRLFYVGAGTSGRLGALDASECPPTFSVSPELVQPIVAGGPEALMRSSEAAEDSEEEGARQMVEAAVTNLDVVCGLSASGRTPFVLGALRQARAGGAHAWHRLQPALRNGEPGRRDGGSGDGTRDHRRLHAAEGGHRAEAGAEHAFYGSDGAAGQGI